MPLPIHAGKKERIYGCVGAFIGLLFTEWISKIALGDLNLWFIAPMGASAVLLFAVPSSPLAQPWSIIGGNLVSAFIGISCAKWIGNPALAAAVAVALAIGAMLALRCLHPPSGAVALTAVLGGPAVTASGYHFLLQPVGVNSIFLLIAALLFNNILHRRYPHSAAPHKNLHQTVDPPPMERLGITRKDMQTALEAHAEILDVNEDDLQELFLQTESQALQRHSGGIRCRDIMSKDVVVVHHAASVFSAWALLEKHKIHALPVVDDARALVGIVTLHDFFDKYEGNAELSSPLPTLKNVGRVEHIMARQIKTTSAEETVSALVSTFLGEIFHHLPVIDEQRRVIGMITQSDLIGALYRAAIENVPNQPVNL